MHAFLHTYPNFSYDFPAVVSYVYCDRNVFTVTVGRLIKRCPEADSTFGPQKRFVHRSFGSLFVLLNDVEVLRVGVFIDVQTA